MDRNYLDEIFDGVNGMCEPEDIWDEYYWHKKDGEGHYNDWKWQQQEPVPDCMLDKLVDDFFEDYEWCEVEQIFKDRLNEMGDLWEKQELKEKLEKDLSKNPEVETKPKGKPKV